MPAIVLEALAGTTSATPTIPLQADDVLVVIAAHSNNWTSTGVTGCGATWQRVAERRGTAGAQLSLEVWVGRSPSSTGTVTVGGTPDDVRLFTVRGARAGQVGTPQVKVAYGAQALALDPMPANDGQVVLTWGATYQSGTVTWPSTTTPGDGWAVAAMVNRGFFFRFGHAVRMPSGTDLVDHSVAVSASVAGGDVALVGLVVGAPYTAPPEPTPPGTMTGTTVTVRGIGPWDWLEHQGIEDLGGGAYVLTSLTGQMYAPVDYLVPGRLYRLRMLVEAVPAVGQTALAVIGGQLRQLPVGAPAWVEWTLVPERPQRLDVRGIYELRVDAVELAATVPEHVTRRDPLPGDVLALEVMAPRAGAAAFRLDSSRLDRDALTVGRPWPGTFVLGTSRLGGAYLHQSDLVDWWHPLLAKARSVTTRRGSSGAVIPTADVGTLSAEFPNAMDPRAMALRLGAPVRLYHWITRTPMFTGQLTRAQVIPSKPGGRLRYVTRIEAADLVARLAAITRHGATATDDWGYRATRLLQSAPGVTWDRVWPVVSFDQAMGPTVLEASLAKHLDVLVASARGAWWVAADGQLKLCPGPPQTDVVATFTDRRRPDDVAPWGYVDATAGWDWQAVVSVVELVNLGAVQDPEQGNAWTESSTATTAVNDTLVATYGEQVAKLETNLADPAAAADLAADLARAQAAEAAVSAVTLDALPAMDRAAALELFTTARAELRGEQRDALVAELSHNITPTAWQTQVALIERMPI